MISTRSSPSTWSKKNKQMFQFYCNQACAAQLEMKLKKSDNENLIYARRVFIKKAIFFKVPNMPSTTKQGDLQQSCHYCLHLFTLHRSKRKERWALPSLPHPPPSVLSGRVQVQTAILWSWVVHSASVLLWLWTGQHTLLHIPTEIWIRWPQQIDNSV